MTDAAEEFAKRVAVKLKGWVDPNVDLVTLIASELRAGGWQPEPIGSMRIEPKELGRLVRLAQRSNPDVQFGHIE